MPATSAHASAPEGSLTDVPGLKVGHHTDPRRPTGCTVVLCEAGAVAGVDVRGAAPGTRETDLLRPDNLVERVHAVLLSGGSAFGLDAAGGVMRWLEAQGHGLQAGPVRIPIVPAAVLFDFWEPAHQAIRPDADAGHAACVAATDDASAQGNVGAGAGARVGKLYGPTRAMRGGLGMASMRVGGWTVGALVAVNATGDVVDPSTGEPVAGARSVDGRHLLDSARAIARGDLPARPFVGGATTIGVVATDAVLTKPQAARLATASHDGLARTIVPAHTLTDGDTMFALATGTSGKAPDLSGLVVLSTLVAEVTARAVLQAVRQATGWPGLPAARDLGGPL